MHSVKLACRPEHREAVLRWLLEAQTAGLVRRWSQNGGPESFEVVLVPQTGRPVEPQLLLNMSEARFEPPRREVVDQYAREIQAPPEDAGEFHAYYESVGWRVGRTPMRNWRAAFRLWVSRNRKWEERRKEAGAAAYHRLRALTDQAMAILDDIRIETDPRRRTELTARRRTLLEEISRLRSSTGLLLTRTSPTRTNSPPCPPPPT